MKVMIKGRWRGRIWIVVPAVVIAAGLGLTMPAHWQLQSIDENDNASVTLSVTATVAFDLLFGAVMEVPRASGCVETPANGHAAFRQLEVIDGNGDALTPDFGTSIPDPQCSVSISATSTSADILWKP